MKKIGILFMAATALTVASCSSTDESAEDEVKVEAVTYKLDKENSTLGWKAADPSHFQAGIVSFSEGSITMKGETLTEGAFTVDMNTISTTSLEGDKAESLNRHLKGLDDNDYHKPEDFFNVNKFGNVSVTLGEYKDGKLSTTLSIVGQELTQDVAVDLTSDENGASIKGSFTMDLTSLNIPGFAVNEDGSGISPVIEFDLNLALKK